MAFLAKQVSQAAISSLLSVVTNKITDELIKEFKLRKEVKKEIKKLCVTLSIIKSAVNEAEEQETQSEALRAWLESLKEILYRADDVLDRYVAKMAIASKEKAAHKNSKVGKWVPPFSISQGSILTSGGIAHKIKDVREKLDSICKDKNNLGLQKKVAEVGTNERLMTTSLLKDDATVVARDQEKKKLLNLLMKPQTANDSNMLVLPIVGMGGIGKTTLARLTYNDEEVKAHFKLRMWVCVSNGFDLMKIIKEIIEAASGESCALTNMDKLQEMIAMKVARTQGPFLLVLDDAWNEKDSEWESLLEPLKNGAKGSRVLITTRITSLGGSLEGWMKSFHLAGLSDESLWELFCRHAFGDNKSSRHAQLEDIGKQMVKTRLRGSPLAAKTIGRLLRIKLDLGYWRTIMNSEIWELGKDDKESVFPSLNLSYRYLPWDLKQCFAYYSVFPKDFYCFKEELILLWMSQCFIQSDGKKRVEDVGSARFDELVSRSLFQFVGDKYSRRVEMHSLIHDIARYASKDDCFRMSDEIFMDFPERIRHVSVIDSSGNLALIENLQKCHNLRTLLFQQHFPSISMDHKFLDGLFRKLKHLRVLGLRASLIKEVPESIGNLIQLRYLDISETLIENLPKSFGNLCNLQVLKVNLCLRFLKFVGFCDFLYMGKWIWARSIYHVMGRVGEP